MTRLVGAKGSLAAAVLSGLALAAFHVPAGASAPSPAHSWVPGLPAGAAEAALRPEATLPVPNGWPFPDAFSRTSGTGRLIGGALEWPGAVVRAPSQTVAADRDGVARIALPRGSSTVSWHVNASGE